MTTLHSPHDRFFKAVFGRVDIAAEFLAGYLPPDVAGALDWPTLRAVKDSFLDPDLALHPTDLLYEVSLCGGGIGYAHVLFEHKSYVEARIGLDLLRYRVRIWEQWLNAGNTGPLPVIVPVVVYHGVKRWRISQQFADGVSGAPSLRECVPTCVYYLVDLSGYRDEELRGAVVLQTALLILKYIFRDDLRERLPGILGLLRALNQNSSGLDYVVTLLRYLAQGATTDRLSEIELRQAVAAALSGGGELMMTIAEQWEQLGIEKGIEKGIKEGISAGELLVLKRQLNWRFGELPEWVEDRLTHSDQVLIERWAHRILEAKSLDSVFEE
jgi:predicted transposase YdaD